MPQMNHIHARLESDINNTLKLVAFISKKSRDYHLNKVLSINLSSYLESFLANEEGNPQLHSYKKHLRELVKFFDQKGQEEANRE